MADKLAQEVAAAKAAGLSYGEWKARQPVAEPVKVEKRLRGDPRVKPEACVVCGGPLPVKRFCLCCSDECRRARALQANRDYYARHKGVRKSRRSNRSYMTQEE